MTLAAEEAPPPEAPPQSRNHLLAVLPPSEFLALKPHLTAVELCPRERLADANRAIEAVYFPHDAVLSMAAVDREGGSVEVGTVGCEGMTGLPVLLGAEQSTCRVVVQIGGQAERMDAAVFRREAGQHEHFERLLFLYAQAFMTQVAQSTACNRLHSAEQRLARWLLICRDRVGRDELPITQETLALMLGVRRATVTESAGVLQRAGVIRYRRGVVVIADRAGLEAASCECYAIVREEFDRLLGVRVG
ncbi:MAG: Crp/Fnr family transcriptional regulator [Gemmatimonadales bacterium]